MEVRSGFSYNFEYGVNIHDKLDEYVDSRDWEILDEQVLEQQDSEKLWTEHQHRCDTPDIPDSENLEDLTFDDF